MSEKYQLWIHWGNGPGWVMVGFFEQAGEAWFLVQEEFFSEPSYLGYEIVRVETVTS